MNTVAMLQREQELLRKDIDQLHLRLDSVEHYMSLQKQSVDTMVTTLKRIISKGSGEETQRM